MATTPDELRKESAVIMAYLKEAAEELDHHMESERVYWACRTLILLGKSVSRMLAREAERQGATDEA